MKKYLKSRNKSKGSLPHLVSTIHKNVKCIILYIVLETYHVAASVYMLIFFLHK